MADAVNECEIRVIGLSRSGNHAIITWLLHQLPGRWCFLNCCQGKQNPFETALPMDDGRKMITNIPELDFQKELAGEWRQKDWLVFSHEDSFLGTACSEVYEKHHDDWAGASGRRRDVLILRDPFNLFASRFRKLGAWMRNETAMRIWKQHARQFLQGPKALRHRPLLISYNEWATSRNYRRLLTEQLGIPFTDEAAMKIPQCAGGSSFDGLQFDGAANEMSLFDRWRNYIDWPQYHLLFDQQVLELAQKIFTDIDEPVEAVRKRRYRKAA